VPHARGQWADCGIRPTGRERDGKKRWRAWPEEGVGRAQLVCRAAHWAERKRGEGTGWAKGAGEHSFFILFYFFQILFSN